MSPWFSSQRQLSWSKTKVIFLGIRSFTGISNVREIIDMTFLHLLSFLFNFSILDKRAPSWDSSGLHPCKSLSTYLASSFTNKNVAFISAFWKLKALFKVTVFVFTTVLGKLNTNDLLRAYWHTRALFPNTFYVFWRLNSCNYFLFFFLFYFHRNVGCRLLIRLFSTLDLKWVSPPRLDAIFLLSFKGRGRRKTAQERNFLCCLWVLCLGRNVRLSEDCVLPILFSLQSYGFCGISLLFCKETRTPFRIDSLGFLLCSFSSFCFCLFSKHLVSSINNVHVSSFLQIKLILEKAAILRILL